MKQAFLKRVLVIISVFSIIAQSLSPYIAFSQNAYAQEAPVVTEAPTPTPDQTTPTITETPPADPTATPTPEVTPEVTPTPTPAETPTETITPTPTEDPSIVTPTPTDNLSPPAEDNTENQDNSDNQSSSNDNQSQVQENSTSTTPTETPTPTPAEKPTGNEQLNLVILDNVSAPTINLEAVAESGSAVLTTDKPDYAPTDTALITGSNLLPNTTYILKVWSDDEPPTGVTAEITSDENGTLVYAYQLDGTYRPNYSAELKDQAGNVVATTTFTDSITTSSATLNGSTNAITVSPNSTISVNLTTTLSNDDDWHSTSWRISNSSGPMTCVNTPDHNTNGETHSFSETFNITAPASNGTYNVYLKTWEGNNCDGEEGTTLTLTNKVITGQAVANPALGQSCGINLVLILDSSDSMSNGDITTVQNAANTLVNSLMPATPTKIGVIDFDTDVISSLSPTTDKTSVLNAITSIGHTGAIEYTNWDEALQIADPMVGSGDLVVIITDGNPTVSNGSLSDLDDAIARANAIKTGSSRILAIGINSSGTGGGITPANLVAISGPVQSPPNPVTVGTDVITGDISGLATMLASLTTALCGGTITVNKYINDLNHRGGANWMFNVSGPNNYSNDLGTDANGQDNTGTIPSGSGYSITETGVQAGYTFGSAVCKNQTGAIEGTSTPNGVNNINISNSDIISCDFINNELPQTGSITITKNVVPNDSSVWDFTVSGLGGPYNHNDLGDGESYTLDNLVPGSYNITEITDPNYTTTVTCGGVGPLDQNGFLGTVVAGQDLACTFTNTLNTATLKLAKTVDYGPAQPGDWTLTASGNGGFSDNGASATFHTVNINTPYTLSESNIPGWSQFGNWQCNGGSLQGNIVTLSSGQNVICTATNHRDMGSVKVNKKTDINGDGDWNDSDEGNNQTAANNWANSHGFSWMVDGGSHSFGATVNNLATNLFNYLHSFDETIPSGYHFVGWYKNGEAGKSCTNPNGTTLPINHGEIQVNKNSTTEITFCNQRDTGTVTIVKDAQPNSDDNFSFDTISGFPGGDFELEDDGNDNNGGTEESKTVTVPTGQYWVEEDGETGWKLADLVCSDANSTVNVQTGRATINVEKDEAVTCTFTNKKLANLIIKKDSTPNSDENFSFTRSFGGDFELEDDGNDNNGGTEESITFSNLNPGDFTVTENSEPGWTLTDIVCSDQTQPNLQGKNVTVNLDFNETVTCTFKNTKLGSIKIIKNSLPNDNQDFEFYRNFGSNFFLEDDGNNSDGQPNNILFSNLASGAYSFGEYAYDNWNLNNITCTGGGNPNVVLNHRYLTVNLGLGENVECTFENLKLGSISGYKYNDKNGDGNSDSGENGLSGWTINLCTDSNCNNILHADTTDGNGYYSFDNLEPDTYYVREVQKTGWQQTNPANNRYTVTITSGQDVSHKDFFNRQLGNITVCKVIIDAQGNITNGSAIPGVSFTINWTGGNGLAPTVFNSGYTPNTQIFSNSEGNDAYCIEYPNIVLANYGYSQEIISESGWATPKYNDQYNTTVLDLEDFNNYQTPNDENSNGYMDLTNNAGPDRTLVILNQYQNGSITGYKWNDLNSDGLRCDADDALSIAALSLSDDLPDQIQICEPKLSGWTINLYQILNREVLGEPIATTITDQDGNFTFDDVAPGEYRVCEVQQNGWEQTFPGDNTCWQVSIGSNSQPTDVRFGNHNMVPSLTISKSNDAGGPKAPGDVVNFTITITNDETAGEADNVTVTDLLPKGFHYNSGSWQATLGLVTLPVSEPTYASPGTWTLPNMAPGDSITLTYSATIDSGQQAGTYYDNAWGQGTSVTDPAVILASADPDAADGNIGDPYFVGTQVAIVNNSSSGVDYKSTTTQEVLGASTGPELPGTGQNSLYVIIASLMLALGAGTFALGFRLKKRYG